MLKNLVLKNRSYRRFKEAERIAPSALKELADLARLTPSASNLQPLKYIISSAQHTNNIIFSTLTWAAKLPWNGPEKGERPAAYIIILEDKELSGFSAYDCGIAAQTILLGAAEKELGGCILGAVNRERLATELSIPDNLNILLVIALGVPAEKVVIDELPATGDTSYWRDEKDIHHTPKRSLGDIVVMEYH